LNCGEIVTKHCLAGCFRAVARCYEYYYEYNIMILQPYLQRQQFRTIPSSRARRGRSRLPGSRRSRAARRGVAAGEGVG
jgi:hypothetical protein